jgi:hypothetical protein
VKAKGPFREAYIEIEVSRADGRVEDMGVVGRWHKNPAVRLKWWLADRLTGKKRRLHP